MKNIVDFCRKTKCDYIVVVLPDGSLEATIDIDNPIDIIKIKDMARNRGFAEVKPQVVITTDEGTVIKNKYGELLEYNEVIECMDDDIRECLHHQLAPCGAQYFYDNYVKMHKQIHGEEFFTERGIYYGKDN